LVTDPIDSPLVIISAPNGARLQKSDHPAVPLSPDELADCSESLLALGVSVLHLHVRDDRGGHTLDAGRYREALAAIRERVGEQLILQVTTEAVGIYDRWQQMALVRELKPEAVSLALRELCPDRASLDEAGEFFRELQEERIWPQFILYSPAEAAHFDALRQDGYFGHEHPFALVVLGRYNDSEEGSPAGLERFLAAAGMDAFPWAVCCIGSREGEAVRNAAELGGHVRIGFESNRFLPDGRLASDNAQLLTEELKLVAESSILQRRVASVDWVRANLAGKQ
jgi:uncharacterized protein (DUF849 family)